MATTSTRFAFDASHLLSFCKKSLTQNVEPQSDSLIDLKMKDMDTRFEKVQKSYEEVMLTELTEQIRASYQEQYEMCIEQYYRTISSLLDQLKSPRTSIEPLSQNPPVETLNSSLKLPPCDTQVFSGSYEEWPAFRDMFTAVYRNHPRLTEAEKLYHLRNKTSGMAGAIVQRFPLSDDNFKLAWEALKSRYENTRVLVDNQITNLFKVPVAITEDFESLQRIHNSVTDCVSMLQTLGVSTEGWDPLLVNLVYSKLPSSTLAQWEQSLNATRDLPSWGQLSEFLQKRCEVVERISNINFSKTAFPKQTVSKPQVQVYASQEKLNNNCKICNEEHSLRICPEFRKMTIQERVDYTFKNRFCNNCLSTSHFKKNCKSKNSCLNCGKKHHTLLHMNSNSKRKLKQEASTSRPNSPSIDPQSSQQLTEEDFQPSTSKFVNSQQVFSNYATSKTNILLRTALVQIECRGELFTIRALIDPGSERTFLSEKIRKRLNLPFRSSHFEIVGVGGQSQTSEKECELVLVSKHPNFKFQITAIVLPKVTNQIPFTSFQIEDTFGLSDLDLADPYFNISSPIDLILGNDSERYINLEGIRRDICGSASAYRTVFGWVLSGPVQTKPIYSFSVIVTSVEDDLNKSLKKFWEQEEISVAKPLSLEDKYCEDFYVKTTKRLQNGRFMVRLPFKKEFPNEVFLGPSRFVALSQYTRMERTLEKNPSLKEKYNKVLNEYITLDHMEATTSKEYFTLNKCNSFYLPHHAVLRPESKTTKVRVVFNASCKTSSGFSLNDALYKGPTLQSDLMTILLNWRLYKFVFSGDIEKMYRQILINPIDRPFQRILYQKSPREAVRDYQLKTVTFGVNCAPYLAIRTLLQLAEDTKNEYPKSSKILRNETYVDDVLGGGHTIQCALESQQQLLRVLSSAGFLLKKITANSSILLESVPKDHLYDSDFLKFQESSSTKTLGIRWNALTDSFTYSYQQIPKIEQPTKRKILSSVAKLFDPAGWISPVIIRGKMLIQQLWLEKVDWDETVSQDSIRIWNEIICDFPFVEKIHLPRWTKFSPNDDIQIHGFCDASKVAYCATVYIRVQSANSVFCNLLTSKTKVAPLSAITLPRLELSGALLLAKLINHITSSLNLQNYEVTLWCDSAIVLAWLAKPPATWKEIYVSNRVSQIHTLTANAKWRHVATNSNPADLGSRGCRAQNLIDNKLWWNGPSWLSKPISEWPKYKMLKSEKLSVVDTNKIAVQQQPHLCLVSMEQTTDILQRFSSYSRALHVMSYVYRFVSLSKLSRSNSSNPSYYRSIRLAQQEINEVKSKLISLAQKQIFFAEYSALVNVKPIPRNSSLLTLNPFLDENGIIRANGRLANSHLPFNERFPIILPRSCHFCHLYLTYLHEFLAHGECNLMCRMVQSEYYITRLKLRVKKVIRHCKTCIIHKKQAGSQLMGALPAERCILSNPFHITGIDFAGPFELKSSFLRKSPTVKGYACVFVCFATKAVHLEACSNLSSEAFQATFARFVGRRGLPKKVCSDNGRNFIGASRVLQKDFSKFLKSISHDIQQKYLLHGFEWAFIPPHAPHMGGLWEAAVKSFKFHLKRVAGSHRFNYEEFSTLLARIEGVLNSRPISAMSEDPMDLSALTPGHFLRGGPIMAMPEPEIPNISIVNRWQKLKAIQHQFCIQWKQDYLKSLHKRYKWKLSSPNLKKDDIVIVMDDLLPPHEWRLGRTEKVYPGPDQHVRVVDVRTTSGILTRPITKICYLPFESKIDPAP